jgi:hypothetical protein
MYQSRLFPDNQGALIYDRRLLDRRLCTHIIASIHMQCRHGRILGPFSSTVGAIGGSRVEWTCRVFQFVYWELQCSISKTQRLSLFNLFVSFTNSQSRNRNHCQYEIEAVGLAKARCIR